MEDQNQKFMEAAIALAKKGMNDNCGGPFGAVVVKDNKIIAQSFNQVTSLNDPTAHAEVVAIREACKVLDTYQLTGCTIYTSCEPCPMCLGAIYWARPDRVVYAATRQDAANADFDDQFIYDEMEKPMHKRHIKFENTMRQEACEVFATWIQKEGKKQY